MADPNGNCHSEMRIIVNGHHMENRQKHVGNHVFLEMWHCTNCCVFWDEKRFPNRPPPQCPFDFDVKKLGPKREQDIDQRTYSQIGEAY